MADSIEPYAADSPVSRTIRSLWRKNSSTPRQVLEKDSEMRHQLLDEARATVAQLETIDPHGEDPAVQAERAELAIMEGLSGPRFIGVSFAGKNRMLLWLPGGPATAETEFMAAIWDKAGDVEIHHPSAQTVFDTFANAATPEAGEQAEKVRAAYEAMDAERSGQAGVHTDDPAPGAADDGAAVAAGLASWRQDFTDRFQREPRRSASGAPPGEPVRGPGGQAPGPVRDPSRAAPPSASEERGGGDAEGPAGAGPVGAGPSGPAGSAARRGGNHDRPVGSRDRRSRPAPRDGLAGRDPRTDPGRGTPPRRDRPALLPDEPPTGWDVGRPGTAPGSAQGRVAGRPRPGGRRPGPVPDDRRTEHETSGGFPTAPFPADLGPEVNVPLGVRTPGPPPGRGRGAVPPPRPAAVPPPRPAAAPPPRPVAAPSRNPAGVRPGERNPALPRNAGSRPPRNARGAPPRRPGGDTAPLRAAGHPGPPGRRSPRPRRHRRRVVVACVVVAALAAGAVVLVPRLHGHRPETAPRAHPATSISRSTPPQTQAPPPSPGPSITSQSPPPVRLVCHASLLAGAGRATAADIEKAHDFVLPSAQGTAHIVLDPKTDDPLLITSWFWGPPNATVTPPNAPPETVGSRTFEYGMASWTSGGQLMTTPVVREEVKPAANWTVGNGTWAQTGIQGQPTTWPKDQHSWASRVLAAVTASGRDLRVTGGELSPAQVMAMANGGWEIIAGSTPALNTGHAVAGRPGQATVVTAVDQVEYRKVDPKSKRLTTVAMWYPGSGTTVKVPAPPVTTPPGCTLNG